MNWSIQTHSMTSVHSFEQAEVVWNEARPWRNELSSWRPLDGHRQVHKRIVRQDEGKSYECTLYSTVLVTYHADGKVSLRCHRSISSRDFAWRVKPPGTRIIRFNGNMFWVIQTPEGERYYEQKHDPLVLVPHGNKWELITEPLTQKEWKYDPKLGAEVRKKLKPFCKWAELTERLLGHSSYIRKPYFTGGKFDASYFLAHPNETEAYPRMLGLFKNSQNLIDTAYLVTGARNQVDAPFDRLPRKQR